ncbi:Os03g0195900, partial [Oryza sativa Japonica Group]
PRCAATPSKAVAVAAARCRARPAPRRVGAGAATGGTAHVGGRESAAGVLLLTWLRHGGGTFAPSRRPAVSRSANPNPAGQSEHILHCLRSKFLHCVPDSQEYLVFTDEIREFR